VPHLEQVGLHAAGEGVHVLLEVLVEVLEHEVQPVLAVNHVVQAAGAAVC
jgi:hypothetical protein